VLMLVTVHACCLIRFGTLSTISTDKDTPGFPATSIIQFAGGRVSSLCSICSQVHTREVHAMTLHITADVLCSVCLALSLLPT
jgi:hypothetical protein